MSTGQGHGPSPAVTIRVVWMDDTLKDYRVDFNPTVSEGQLVLQGRSKGDDPSSQRTIRIPLANVRWWGTPGEQVAW